MPTYCTEHSSCQIFDIGLCHKSEDLEGVLKIHVASDSYIRVFANEIIIFPDGSIGIAEREGSLHVEEDEYGDVSLQKDRS